MHEITYSEELLCFHTISSDAHLHPQSDPPLLAVAHQQKPCAADPAMQRARDKYMYKTLEVVQKNIGECQAAIQCCQHYQLPKVRVVSFPLYCAVTGINQTFSAYLLDKLQPYIQLLSIPQGHKMTLP